MQSTLTLLITEKESNVTVKTTQPLDKLRREIANGTPIKMSPLDGNVSSYDAVRRARNGEFALSEVPYVLDCNKRQGCDTLRDTASAGDGLFDLNDRAQRAEYSRRIKEAWTSDPQSVPAREMAAYREFQILNDIMASPWALAAFQTVTLMDDEMPLIDFPMSRLYNTFTVKSISDAGRPTEAMWGSTRDMQQIDIGEVSTPLVRYSTRNLIEGDINELNRIQSSLQYEMDMKIDALALANINANVVASGLQDDLNIHPDIVLANIPDENELDLSASDAGVLTLAKLQTILLHILKFGTAGDGDRPFTISNIQMSPENVHDAWDFVSLVSGWDTSAGVGSFDPKQTVPPEVRSEIFRTGSITQAWGQTWTNTPNPQIAKGTMYVFTTEPVGWAFYKPSNDVILNYDERNNTNYALERMGETMARKAVSFYIPASWRRRFLKVTL